MVLVKDNGASPSRSKSFVTCFEFIVKGHSVQYKHNSFSGAYQLRIDGTVEHTYSSFFDKGKSLSFDLCTKVGGYDVTTVQIITTPATWYMSWPAMVGLAPSFKHVIKVGGHVLGDLKQIQLELSEATSRFGTTLNRGSITGAAPVPPRAAVAAV